MTVRVSSASFARYLAAQSTTRVAKVRDAKRMMSAPRGDFPRMDYWLALREAAVARITGASSSKDFAAAISNVSDPKKTANYRTAGVGLQKWIGRKTISAYRIDAKTWEASGLEVSVTPELRLSWSSDKVYVLKLYFNAEPLSKYQANPLLRLIECTHGSDGTAAVLDVQRAKLHTGPTTKPQDLDLLLRTEAASFVAIWNSI